MRYLIWFFRWQEKEIISELKKEDGDYIEKDILKVLFQYVGEETTLIIYAEVCIIAKFSVRLFYEIVIEHIIHIRENCFFQSRGKTIDTRYYLRNSFAKSALKAGEEWRSVKVKDGHLCAPLIRCS